ncbi:MAG TPA: SgcJ/EcaC family oxidoreductase [Nonomuraea sp.]|nr:SgcJ/EcaC family oxidoreductase [Nonomuraea sp.]
MNKFTRSTVSICCAALVADAVVAVATAPAAATSPAKGAPGAIPACAAEFKTVRAVAEEEVPAAWKNNDPEAFAAHFTQDGTFVVPGPGGVYLNGRAQIRSYMSGVFAGPGKGSTVTAKVLNSRCLTPTVAVLITTGGMMLPGETQPPAERIGVQTWTITNKRGRWLVAAYQNARGVALDQ